jgi:uracil-DNA glycosylase family 4
VDTVAELLALRAKAFACRQCNLAETRTNVVFGDGNINQPVIAFVGEAPGANEDEQGKPFIGRAGAILDEWIAWMGFKREQVYILNTLLCRPPKNRNPLPAESKACRPFFDRQLELIRPMTIVGLGKFAAAALTEKTDSLKDLRRGWWSYNGIPVRVTYHPAFLARNPTIKSAVYGDLGAVRARIDEILRTRNNEECIEKGPR